MKNKILFITLLSLVFLGCTRTLVIEDKNQAVYYEKPVVYQEEIPVYVPAPVYQPAPVPQRRVVYNEVPPPPVSMPITGDFNITPLEVFDKIQETPNLMILDVRTPQEIPTDGKIANSILIPLHVLANNLNRLDKSKQIVVYCYSGNRSVDATKFLRSRGFDALNMKGGIAEWKKNHLAVTWK